MKNTIRLYIDQLLYATLKTRKFARQHIAFYNDFESRIGKYLNTLANKRVLDIGCGRLYWFSLLLHNRGSRVTGIDQEFIKPFSNNFFGYFKLIKNNSFLSSLKTLLWHAFYARSYYNEIYRLAPFNISSHKIDFQKMDASQFDFPDNTFDLIVSHEVFEHLPDVPSALSEMRRVMKIDSFGYIYIHNYTSISGGHNIKWKYPDSNPPNDVPAWDHLRENKFPDIPSFINRYRLDDYRLLFNKYFDILEWCPTQKEGINFLTKEIREELRVYSEEELLTKGIILVVRPK